jgi:hypothetical protein
MNTNAYSFYYLAQSLLTLQILKTHISQLSIFSTVSRHKAFQWVEVSKLRMTNKFQTAKSTQTNNW